MSGKNGKNRRVTELLALVCLVGLLVSVAVPFHLRQRRQAWRQQAVAAAGWHREELARWLEGPAQGSVGVAMTGAREEPLSGKAGQADDVWSRLREYADRFAAGGRDPAAVPPGPMLCLEPPGISPEACRRDGRIHLVPVVDPSGEVRGASIVATDSRRAGGPGDDGVLVLYRISTPAGGAAVAAPPER